MLLSLSLLLAALLVWRGGWAKVPVYSEWVFLGMAASFVGDLVMARLIPFPNRLIGGMLCFGVAHALYINAYYQTLLTTSSLEPYNRFTITLIVGLTFYGLVTLLAWWFLIRNPSKGSVVNVAALIYGLWIAVMASSALALASALGGTFWLAVLGGLLFIASDFILGTTNIRGARIRSANDWVWLTYVAGQMGIIYAGAVG
jgi:hypothetical protein